MSRPLIIPLQCSTCIYYAQQGTCTNKDSRFCGEATQPDEYCRSWDEQDLREARRQGREKV